jgi:hypothetical protein
VRRLERALIEALAICTEAQDQALSERQARRLQLRVLALVRALEETGGGRMPPMVDEEAVEAREG